MDNDHGHVVAELCSACKRIISGDALRCASGCADVFCCDKCFGLHLCTVRGEVVLSKLRAVTSRLSGSQKKQS